MNEWRNYIFIEGEGFVYWPLCRTIGCTNRMNRAAGNGYCWPCQPSGKTLDELIDELRPAHDRSSVL